MGAPETTPKIPGLGLDDFLRHSASGAFLLLTVYHLRPSTFGVENGHTIEGETVALIIALAFPLGALVYSLHRAVVHPIFERLITVFVTGFQLKLDSHEFRTLRWVVIGPTDAEMFFFWARWDRLKRFRKVHEYMTRAASQMHFLYTVPLAYLLGCLAVSVMTEKKVFTWDGWSTAAVAIFAAALIDNYRLSSIEIKRVKALYDGTFKEADRRMPRGPAPSRSRAYFPE